MISNKDWRKLKADELYGMYVKLEKRIAELEEKHTKHVLRTIRFRYGD